jgi:hypothetical protein
MREEWELCQCALTVSKFESGNVDADNNFVLQAHCL